MSAENSKPDDIIDVEPRVINPSTDADEKPARIGANRKLGLGAALGVVCALAGGFLYRDVLANYLPNDQVQALSARADAIESAGKESAKRLDAVVAMADELKLKLDAAQTAAQKSLQTANDAGAKADGADKSLTALRQSLEDAGKQLDEMKTTLASDASASSSGAIDPALAARIAALEKDVASLKAAGPGTKPDIAALSQSIADMKAKIANGAGFADELGRVRRMVPSAEGLDILEAEAASGLANSSQLAKDLESIVAALPKDQPASSGSSDGWYDSVANFFSSLVTIKDIGAADISGTAEKAAAFAASGDLKQAIDTFAADEGLLTQELRKWRDRASRRLKLEQALEKTSAAVLREIAARG